jgi:osmotically-inducible protein OsmY
MNSKSTRKIVALGAMAAVIAVGAVMFTRGSHSASPETATAVPPPPVAQTADAAAAAMPPTVAAAAAVAPLSDAPAPVTRNGSVDGERPVSAPAPKSAYGRSLARASSDAGAMSRTATPAVSGEAIAPESVANRVERLASTGALAPDLIPGTSATGGVEVGTGAVPIASDSQITTDVKTAIAGDIAVKDFNIGVSTTDGVVALTGSVASQGDIDQAKDVAGKVKDVKRVDISALILASL